MEQIERRHCDLARDLGIAVCAELEHHFAELRKMRLRHPPDRRGERPPARARDGDGRADGDAHRRALPRRGRPRRAVARCAHVLHAEERAGATRTRQLPVRHLRLRARSGAAAAAGAPAARVLHHAGLHRQRRARARPCCSAAAAPTPPAATSRPSCRRARLEIWTDVPGMFTRQPAPMPTARLLQVAHYDEAQEIAEQRRQGAAPALHPAGQAVRAFRCRCTPRSARTSRARSSPRTGGDGGARRSRRSASRRASRWSRWRRSGMWHQVGFLADAFAGVQGARPVGGPGLHLRDQRHRVARPGRQHARRRALEALVDDARRGCAASR